MTSQFSAEVPHRLDMTLDVDLDVKPQMKQTKDWIALVRCFTHNLQARLVLDLLFLLLLISKYL